METGAGHFGAARSSASCRLELPTPTVADDAAVRGPKGRHWDGAAVEHMRDISPGQQRFGGHQGAQALEQMHVRSGASRSASMVQ